MSERVLILFATRHGQTARIAERLGRTLAAEGITAVERDVRHDAGELHPAQFDGVIVGGSVHRGHHERQLLEWIAEHHTSLTVRPSAFFSVSLTAAEDSDEARAVTRSLIDDVLDETGWIPSMAAAFAGALQFERYDLPTRVLMRLIATQHGADADASHDVEYTDWDAVDRFAQAFARRVRQATARASERSAARS